MKNLLERLGLRTDSAEDGKIEQAAYALAAQEMASGEIAPGLMAKAYSQAEGDERKAKAVYLKLRAEQIEEKLHAAHEKEKAEAARSRKQEEKQQKERRKKKSRQRRKATSNNLPPAKRSDPKRDFKVLLSLAAMIALAFSFFAADLHKNATNSATDAGVDTGSNIPDESKDNFFDHTPEEVARRHLEDPAQYVRAYRRDGEAEYIVALTAPDDQRIGPPPSDASLVSKYVDAAVRRRKNLDGPAAQLHLLKRNEEDWDASWKSSTIRFPDTTRIAFKDFGIDGIPSIYWEDDYPVNEAVARYFYFYDLETGRLHTSHANLSYHDDEQGRQSFHADDFTLDSALASGGYKTYARFLVDKLMTSPGFDKQGRRSLLQEFRGEIEGQSEDSNASSSISSGKRGQCDIREITGDSGQQVKLIAPKPVAGNNLLQIGFSVQNVGDDYFLTSVARFRFSAENVTGPLQLALQNGDAVSLNVVQSKFSNIGGSQVSMAKYALSRTEMRKLKASPVETVTVDPVASGEQVMEANMSSVVIAEQLKCLD